MEQEILAGVGQSGDVATRAQKVLLTLRESNVFKPSVKQMVENLKDARFFTAFFYVANEVSGGALTTSDLFAKLDQTPSVGVLNFTSKKIDSETAMVIERLELQWASVVSSNTSAAKDIVAGLVYSPVFSVDNSAPAAIQNGEIEFSINSKIVAKVPVSAFEETVDGVAACPYGLNLEALQLLQTDETVGVKFVAASSFADSSTRYFLKLGVRGLGLMKR